MCQRPVVHASLTRQCQPGHVTRDPQALLPAHNPERPYLFTLILVYLPEHLRGKQTLSDLRRKHSILSNVREGVIAHTIAIDSRDALPNRVSWEPFHFFLGLFALAEHICLFRHLAQPMSSHDIGICNFLLFLSVR